MQLNTVRFGNISVSRFIIGSNPFSGFSHQGKEQDLEMRHYYTASRIKEVLKKAEELGINTVIARADHHIIRVLMEYWDEGGGIQWIAQTCPELGNVGRAVQNAISGGAKACYIHGGQMDYFIANEKYDEIKPALDTIKDAGLAAGVAGHNPDVFKWAEENIDIDFYMCAYYNSAHRDKEAEHRSGTAEWFSPEDRQIMVEQIQKLSKPVIHYKVLAAGRNGPKEAFAFVAKHLREQDAVCVGVYTKDNPSMIEEDIRLLLNSLQK